jgi:uncharacterized protein (DUF1800 family)
LIFCEVFVIATLVAIATALFISTTPARAESDPVLEPKYKRNLPLERAILDSLRSSSLKPEQLAQHALDRLGFGAGTQPGIRWLVRLTNGQVDKAKTHAAILSYIMYSLQDSRYERPEVEKMLATEFPSSRLNYFEISEKSGALSRALNWSKKEIKDLIEFQNNRGLSPQVEQLVEYFLEISRARLEREGAAFHGFRHELMEASQGRLIANAVNNTYGFKTKLVYLWFNRLNVDAAKVSFDFTDYINTIASHTHGRFADMLLASARHPAMLIYLNNYTSRADGANRPTEDYGRELLELHSLGVPVSTVSSKNSYTLDDVRTAARIMSGWSVVHERGRVRQFFFQPKHNPNGSKRLLGKDFGDGESGGVEFIRFLAEHQSTAGSIAKMLVTYFVSERLDLQENKDLVKKLKESFVHSGGDLSQLYQQLVSDPTFWSASAFRSKVNDPFQQVVKTLKVAGFTAANLHRAVLLRNDREVAAATPMQPVNMMPGAAPVPAPKSTVPSVSGAISAAAGMGLDLFKCVPPTGYSVRSDRWMSANNVLATIRFAFHHADYKPATSRQEWVTAEADLAEEQMAKGNIDQAKVHLRRAMAYGYGNWLGATRFDYQALKYERILNNALNSPDWMLEDPKSKEKSPLYLRSAAGLYFGSVENSVQ